MARGERLGVFALSEPEAGSDAASLTCQAVRDGDCWVLNGTKSWVSGGAYAGVAVVLARTGTPKDRRRPRGINALILTPDIPRLPLRHKEDKKGVAGAPPVALTFYKLSVPAPTRRWPGG